MQGLVWFHAHMGSCYLLIIKLYNGWDKQGKLFELCLLILLEILEFMRGDDNTVVKKLETLCAIMP